MKLFLSINKQTKLYTNLKNRINFQTFQQVNISTSTDNQYISSDTSGSSNEQGNSQNFNQFDLKQRILEESLKNVGLYGWSDESIVRAVNTLNMPSLTYKMISRGPVEIVELFLTKKREYVKEQIKKLEFETSDDKKLLLAIEYNFIYLQPYISNWPSAIALLASPTQLPYTIQILLDIADDLCLISNNRSTRFDWYTDRALLMSLYCSCELFLLTDYSENMNDTRQFLHQNFNVYTSLKESSLARFGIQDIIEKVISYTSLKNNK
eukprot:gene7110-9702_t